MDRNIVYPGGIPLDTDLLETNRHAMVALGALMRAVLGTAPVADGLAVAPTVPASLAVQVGPGSLTSLVTVDATAYGSLAADTASALVKPSSWPAKSNKAVLANGYSLGSSVLAANAAATSEAVTLVLANTVKPATVTDWPSFKALKVTVDTSSKPLPPSLVSTDGVMKGNTNSGMSTPLMRTPLGGMMVPGRFWPTRDPSKIAG